MFKKLDFFEWILLFLLVCGIGLITYRIYQVGKVELEILELFFPYLTLVTGITAGYEGAKNWKGGEQNDTNTRPRTKL